MTDDDTTRVDAPRHTDETPDARLAQIHARSRRLAAIPMDTSAEHRVMRDMIDSIGDVRWLLERVAHLDSARDSAVREWKTEHDGADELQRERDDARAQLRTEADIAKALLQDKNELIMRAHHAEVARDQARDERAELVELLGWHVDAEDDPCRHDHHGHCQAHGSLEDGPCRTAASRELLARIRGKQQPEDGDGG